MTDPENDKTPATNGYTWAQIAPTHGAHSPEIRDPVAAQVLAELHEIATAEGSAFGYLIAPAFRYELNDLAMAEAQKRLIQAWLAEFGWINDGEVRAAAHYLEKVARRAERLRTRLGLTPLSRAQLQVDVGLSATLEAGLDQIRADGARFVPDDVVVDVDDT
jgi:hypothetical protein